MDLPQFKEVRFFRIASHNGNSSAEQGEPSASNFNVVIADDMARVGNLAAFSVENVTFPNLFPNIVVGRHTLLIRNTLPDADGFDATIEGIPSDYSIVLSNNQMITFPLTDNPLVMSTADWIPILNANFAPYLEVSMDAFGALFFISLVGPIRLTTVNWVNVFGVASNQLNTSRTSFVAYPYVIDRVGLFPTGFYSLPDVTSMLTTELNLLPWSGGDFTVDTVFTGLSERLRISNPTVPFMISHYAPAPSDGIDYRQLSYQLGFQTLDTVLSTSVEAELNPSLQGEQVVYLHSNAFASAKKAFSGEGAPDSLIATIPVFWAGYGDVVAYSLNQWESPVISYDREVSPKQFDFCLKNIHNDILDIGWNQNMTITFRLFFRPTR